MALNMHPLSHLKCQCARAAFPNLMMAVNVATVNQRTAGLTCLPLPCSAAAALMCSLPRLLSASASQSQCCQLRRRPEPSHIIVFFGGIWLDCSSVGAICVASGSRRVYSARFAASLLRFAATSEMVWMLPLESPRRDRRRAEVGFTVPTAPHRSRVQKANTKRRELQNDQLATQRLRQRPWWRNGTSVKLVHTVGSGQLCPQIWWWGFWRL